MSDTVLHTERLILRRWREADRTLYAAMMADPEVGDMLGGVLTADQAGAQVDRFIAAEGASPEPGFLALERAADGAFLGAAALRTVHPDHPMAGSVELGWRLARPAWGHGYATEAARALIGFGFERLSLEEIVAFTATSNLRSQAVMTRLGMVRRPERDFDHPALPDGHPLRPHIVCVVLPSAAHETSEADRA